MALLTHQQIIDLGFARVGENVKISDKASFYNTKNIHLGSNVRIDDFCVLSAGEGGIYLGDYIHVAVYSSLIGAGKISIASYCNISSKVAIYSSNDDYSGEFMTNPMVPSRYTNVSHADVTLEPHVIVGCNTVILPGVTLAEGCAIGALSLVNQSLTSWGVYAGQPAKYIKPRSQQLLNLAKQFEANNA